MQKRLASLLVVTAVALTACSGLKNPKGMDYIDAQSRAQNFLRHFDFVNIPADAKAPVGFSSWDASSEKLQPATVDAMPVPPSNDDSPSNTAQQLNYLSMVKSAMNEANARSLADNQLFGYIFQAEVPRIAQAQRLFLSRAVYPIAKLMRKTQKTYTIHTDVLRQLNRKDYVVHTQAVYLENETLGCSFKDARMGDAPVGKCALVFASVAPEEQDGTLIPPYMAPWMDELVKKQEEQTKKDLIDAIPDIGGPRTYGGWRFGYDKYQANKSKTVFLFMRWDGEKWVKSDDFDQTFEPVFAHLAEVLEPTTFVYHKPVLRQDGRYSAPYLIERGLYDHFFKPNAQKVIEEPKK